MRHEKITLYVLSLNVIRSIVEQHGGTIEKNPITDNVWINAPPGKAFVCAREIEEQVDAMCDGICTQALAFFDGEILAGMSTN
ncbi:MAG: hypothetical protein HWN68_12240 [Desulfobacterales bacterium]|nr:hypothetical protein [Desulfobacterales bacterium]